jgi:hypothetical protein
MSDPNRSIDVFQPKAQEAHERELVADLIFDLLIGQIVKCLQASEP